MENAAPTIERLKQSMKASWMAGDFGQIARYNADEAEKFVERLNIPAGCEVLDVACGTGNLAIPIARRGAKVIGVDIATNLLEQARARAASENLSAEFREGDAEQLPFAAAQFDVVVSMFGAMFAPRPALVAAELTRVCRPSGFIAMANWTPQGFVGKMFAASARHVPPPPGIDPPVLWGKEEIVRERFAKVGWKVEATPTLMDFKYPFSAAEVVEFFRKYFGPTQVAYSRLDEVGQKALSGDLEKLWNDHNESSAGEIRVKGEFLSVRATKI